ncbi:MAG: ATP-dependent sacrificial sulfur transferase LarE [Gemmatimonadaceae bacterium]
MTGTPASPVLLEARAKEARLMTWLGAQRSALLGFSGGVDSAYLGCVAVAVLGPERVLAVIGRSPSYPASQWAAARAVAERFGLRVLEVDTHEMDDPNYAANPANRCYFCKSELWTVLGAIARERSIATLLDGTNADDLGDVRPGRRAGAERGVHSPLASVGLTKAEIRILSEERGIPTWSHPSSPCLSSRLPYGTEVTIGRLQQVERAERALRLLGVRGDLRVRYHGDLARVEVPTAEVSAWLTPGRMKAMRAAVNSAGFARVAIDLRGFRSGSLNVLAGVGSA